MTQPAAPVYENSITIDWLRFTVNGSEYWDCFADWLQIDGDVNEWTQNERYGRKWGRYLMEGVAVWSDDVPAAAVDRETGEITSGAASMASSKFTVDFSGNGLALWAEKRGENPLEVIRHAHELAGDRFQVMRLDVAFDDHEKFLEMHKMRRYLKSDLAVTRWEKFQWLVEESIGIRDDDKQIVDHKKVKGIKGTTIYLGSRLSDAFARVYDKRAEVLAKMNHDQRRVALASGQLPEHWVRFELELKRNHAHDVAVGMIGADNPEHYALEVLRGKIDFKATSGDKRVRRRGAVRWWEQFTQSCGSRPIRIPRPVITLQRIKGWVGHAVAPSIALLTRAYQGGMEWLKPLVEEGEKRLDNKRLALLNGFGVGMASAAHSS